MASNCLVSSAINVCVVAICLLHVKSEPLSTTQESCYKENAIECNGAGVYNCGVCECNTGHFGRMCECAGDDNGLTINKCTPPGATSDLVCSGRGTCLCNQCECDLRANPDETITGNWCECDNFSCSRYNGKICGGHGKCDCGQCICEPNWRGESCECYIGEENCYLPAGKASKPCEGHGSCVCGACKCDTTEEGKFSGLYCENSPSTVDDSTAICDQLRFCVRCQMYDNGPYSQSQCLEMCQEFVPISVDTVTVNEENDEFLCASVDENGCKYAFSFKERAFDNDGKVQYIVKAQHKLMCPSKSSD